MTIDNKEKQFENSIESTLLGGGYIKRDSSDLNKEYIIDSELFFQFIQDSQKDKWQKLQEIFGSDTKEKILQAYEKELGLSSLIHVIRKGFTISGIKLDCLFLKPVSSLNPEAETYYQKNILSVIRQARFGSENRSVDLLLCLNGIPVATAELKNPATGQSYEDAIKQYKEDRDPKEKLFSFKRGALVHFAIDPHEVYMTTKIQEEKTQFLPFNKGQDEGKGNPDNPDGYQTSYLWERIWQKDTWIEIISNFIDLQIIPQKHPLPDKENLIFPRYHQLDAVLQLTSATKNNGPGTNYLIQHSTGSGKSNTIAWLAYKLFSLHSLQDKPVFDSILVLSDRVGIVNQLGNTIQQFEQTPGTVITVEKTPELADTLATQRKIIISTQQKFPYVLDHITKVKGKYFAVIIDEAHSSQSAESRKRIQQVLTTNLDEAAEQESQIEDQEKDITDQIEKEMEERGPQQTLSYYAFTATPRKKTLKLFGTKIGDQEIPFHIYSMKQAIQEGFILDVLKNYTTYERYFRIVKTASEDKVVEGKKASRALLKYVDLHHLNLQNKAKVIVEHFREHTQPKIGRLAKAMVVGSSRLQAKKYKDYIDEYIQKQGYEGIKTLVAFSGSLKDETGAVFTEQSINKTKTEQELREKFDTPEFNILIAAEKYQTGFDQPLLHTMYVDKKLYGIKAVQTLSRLNRTNPGKTDTFVVDFQNKIDEIYGAFTPYYQGTSLVDKTDQSYLFNLYSMIIDFGIITEADLDKFAETFFKPLSKQTDADHGRLYAAIDPILRRFIDAEEKSQDDFKTKITKYIESYSFLSQVVPYDDTRLEKMYAVLKFIINENLIKNIGTPIPELKGDVSLQWYRLEKTDEGGILLGQGDSLKLRDDYGTPKQPEILTSLSEVIRAVNDKFGGSLSSADTITIEDWISVLKNDPLLRDIAKENTFEDFFKQFEKRFLDVVIGTDEPNQALVRRIYTEPEFQKELVIAAAQLYHTWVKSNSLPPITPTDPARNREIFRQTIYRCKGFVHWLDLYLNENGLDFMIDSFDKKGVKEIKLLTGLYDNEYSINEGLLQKFKAYQQELQKDGIDLEMRVITTKDGRNRVAHDRYLLGKNTKFNVVSFSLLQKGRFSEIKKTENEIPFEEYWNDPDSYDLVKDWDKIKGLSVFDVKCSGCGKDTQVPFRPDGIRPVYCKDCWKKQSRTLH
jgi:type I restriction enzyme, R subunit